MSVPSRSWLVRGAGVHVPVKSYMSSTVPYLSQERQRLTGALAHLQRAGACLQRGDVILWTRTSVLRHITRPSP